MVTISTGGMSLSKHSIASYNSPFIECILMAFMFIGATTLILYHRAFKGDWKSLFLDSQVQLFGKIILGSICLVTAWEWWESKGNLIQIVRDATFSVVAVATSTGLSTKSMGDWGSLPTVLFLLLTFIGGCTGSTAGGIKIFRFQVMMAVAKAQLYQLRHPHGIFLPKYNAVSIQEGVFTSVFTFFTLYGISFGLISLALSWFGLDLLTCMTYGASVLGNSGFGFSNIGNAGFGDLPMGAKYVLMIGMLLGRLELVTVFILFSRSFWRD
jgi:trk system potassium uptake protein TrkH